MGLVKVKFKDGKKADVYPEEKYRLIKKGKLDISKKEQEEYDAKFAAEKKAKEPVVLEGSQYDRLRKRVDDLESEVLDLKIEKEKKSKPETKEEKHKKDTK